MTTVILGGADCVLEDIAAFEAIGTIDHVVAINDIGIRYPVAFDAWVSLHPEKLIMWLEDRRKLGLPDPERLYMHRDLNSHERRILSHSKTNSVLGMERGGSSGLFATLIALSLWRGNVVLCGIPMLAERAHFFSERPWTEAINYQQAWVRTKGELIPRVRSMSGFTQELLGKPDVAWIKETQHA